MTRRVYKYPLIPGGTHPTMLPAGAEILHVDIQGTAVSAWALVDVSAELDPTRHILVVGTGHDMPGGVEVRHINTFLVDGGQYVFHAFEVIT